eukprot:6467372-Ditylum_brightwellii.AAC.1
MRFHHDAIYWAKKQGLSTDEIKDFNIFVSDKIENIIDKCLTKGMHVIGKFKDILLSSNNKEDATNILFSEESVQSKVSQNSDE